MSITPAVAMISKISKASARFLSGRGLPARPVPRPPGGARFDHNGREHEEREAELTEADLELCELIGNREVVGFGANGEPSYFDCRAFPFPAVRWQECAPGVAALREKERGDWKELTVDEKRALYRASFRQTFAEMAAPTGQWKSVVGAVLTLVGVGLWMHIFFRAYVHNPRPHTFGKEAQQCQLKRMLDLKVNPVVGLASKWDLSR